MLGQNQPGLATTDVGGGGIIFLPAPPACRTLFVLHVGKNQKKRNNEVEEELTWRGGGGGFLSGLLRWWCCGGGRWRCRGSRTAAPSGAAAISKGYVFSRFCVLFLFLSFPPGFKISPSSQFWVFSGSLLFGCLSTFSVLFFFLSQRFLFFCFFSFGSSSSPLCWR